MVNVQPKMYVPAHWLAHIHYGACVCWLVSPGGGLVLCTLHKNGAVGAKCGAKAGCGVCFWGQQNAWPGSCGCNQGCRRICDNIKMYTHNAAHYRKHVKRDAVGVVDVGK